MAGDWLKVCKETPSKPEILVIATKLNIHPDIAFARCFNLWAWFDSNTKDGVTSGVTKVTLDALLHRDGLCDALVSVGWLGEKEDGNLYLPNFDRHNSETAKVRALGVKRQAKHRDKSNANSNANVTQDALPEKRREEKKDTITQTRGTRLPSDIELSAEWGNEALETRTDWCNEDVIEEFKAFKDHWKSQPGQKGVKTDWLATWRNWCRRSFRKGKVNAV